MIWPGPSGKPAKPPCGGNGSPPKPPGGGGNGSPPKPPLGPGSPAKLKSPPTPRSPPKPLSSSSPATPPSGNEGLPPVPLPMKPPAPLLPGTPPVLVAPPVLLFPPPVTISRNQPGSSVTMCEPRSRIAVISSTFPKLSLNNDASNSPVREFTTSKNALRSRYTLPDCARRQAQPQLPSRSWLFLRVSLRLRATDHVAQPQCDEHTYPRKHPDTPIHGLLLTNHPQTTGG